MNAPLVSVVMAVRNGERFLASAIESVLAQDYRPLEIILVDGHSTDRTAAIAKGYGLVRYVPQQGYGIADAYNCGIASARGEFVAFLSHDDTWAPDKLSTQVAYLQEHPEVGYTVARAKFFLEPGSDIPAGFRGELLTGDHVARVMENLVVRRQVLDEVGEFNAAMSIANDVDWFARANDKGIRSAVLPKVLLHKRIHDSNLSQTPVTNTRDLLLAMRDSIDRKKRSLRQQATERPFVSAIIPVYNGAKYLREAIQSVLAQDYTPLEIIVIDDGSTDESVAVAEAFGPPVQVHSQAHAGAAAARNAGVRLAKGKFLAFLDADDLWTENKLAIQVTALRQDASIDMVFGQVSQFYSPELPSAQKSQIALPLEVMPGYVPGSMLIRRESFERAGPFATDWHVGEFIDWYLRAQEKGLRALTLGDVVLLRRIHESNLGIRERGSREDYVRILKAALDRRRSGNSPAIEEKGS